MSEITRVYLQKLPAMRFVGKRYSEQDAGGGFGSRWGQAFADDLFGTLERACGRAPEQYEDSDAYIGLEQCKPGEPWYYWIGEFFAPDAAVPDGFESVDFAAATVAAAWVRGREDSGELYGNEGKCIERFASELNVSPAADENGCTWTFERYGCPRFTTPDADGKVTLDVCAFVGWEK